jgi:hypothetical protein
VNPAQQEADEAALKLLAVPFPIRGARVVYRGYHVYYDPPPIPLRTCDWHFVHLDWDEGDKRCGHAVTAKDAYAQIDDIEDDQ